MRREKKAYLVTNGIIEGKCSKGHSKKRMLLDVLTKCLNVGRVIDV